MKMKLKLKLKLKWNLDDLVNDEDEIGYPFVQDTPYNEFHLSSKATQHGIIDFAFRVRSGTRGVMYTVDVVALISN